MLLTLILSTIAVLLFEHSAADSVRAVGWITALAGPWLGKLPPDLQALIYGPIIGFLFHWLDKGVTALLARIPGLQPVADAIEAGGGWTSILKALAVWAIGYFATGLPLAGIVASGLRAAGQAVTTSTPAGLAKAKTVAVVAGMLLALSLGSPSMAAAPATAVKPSAFSLAHFSFSPGVGYRWEKSLGNATAIPYWDVQAGYAPWDRVKLTGRFGHNLGPLGGGQTFGEARLGLVF